MNRSRKAVFLVVVLSLLLSGYTCNKQKALQTSSGVAASLKALQDGEIAAHQQGQVTDAEHRLLQEGLKSIAQEDKVVRQCIYASGAQSCVDSGIATVQVFLDSKVNGIKNPDSRVKMQLLGQSVITSLNILKGAL